MRNRSDINTEPRVAIQAIADRTGTTYEAVAQRIPAADVLFDWDATPCAKWSTAKALFETLTEEKRAADAEYVARLNKQLDDEAKGRAYPYAAWKQAQEKGAGLVGTQATVPDGPEPAWAKEGE